MTLQLFNEERSKPISSIIPAVAQTSKDDEKEDKKSNQIPKPSEGTYQPADDPDEDIQQEAEDAPTMPQAPIPKKKRDK